MKLTSRILIILLLVFTGGLFASNLVLKKLYDHSEKEDRYLTYGAILQQPFKHLSITGGNVTNIIYEQRANPSVRVYKEWYGFDEGKVKARVVHDTLYLDFPNAYRDIYEKKYLMYNTLVRIFSPELLSVTGVNTNLKLSRFNQPDLIVDLSGRTKFTVESMVQSFNNLTIHQRDSSEATINMSAETKTIKEKVENKQFREEKYGWACFKIGNLEADLKGSSMLDVGHAQIDSMQISVADTAAILLSGGAMRKSGMFLTRQ